jgi:glycosyltransferase involved in cell wall biosynthesis
MVLFLHNRYRTTGGEERVVDELLSLVRDRLGEPAELLARDSAELGRARAAAGLVRGGLAPRDVAKAVRMTGARVVHAHNLSPLFGWRSLAAAREQGAHVVLHLHQYRLVCATGVCFTGGRECTRCHGRNTLPGVVHNCRGNRSEALAYGASLAMWQRRLAAQADAVIVPSVFARERLRELGAPLDFERVHVLAPPVKAAGETAPGADAAEWGSAGPGAASAPRGAERGAYALVVSRLAPEKGVDVAIDACQIAGVPLAIAGDGPELDALRARAGDGDVRFLGRVDDRELERLRAHAALGRDIRYRRRRGDGGGPTGRGEPHRRAA